jgi:arsenate reductase
MKKRILFICTRNSCRSQMAEAILRHLYGDRYEVASAGTEPTEIDPGTIAALDEKGVDTSALEASGAWEYIDDEWDLVVTVCDRARGACPYFPGGKRHVHEGFRDPPALVEHGMSTEEAFGTVRDEIWAWVAGYFGE